MHAPMPSACAAGARSPNACTPRWSILQTHLCSDPDVPTPDTHSESASKLHGNSSPKTSWSNSCMSAGQAAQLRLADFGQVCTNANRFSTCPDTIVYRGCCRALYGISSSPPPGSSGAMLEQLIECGVLSKNGGLTHRHEKSCLPQLLQRSVHVASRSQQSPQWYTMSDERKWVPHILHSSTDMYGLTSMTSSLVMQTAPEQSGQSEVTKAGLGSCSSAHPGG